MTDKGLDFTPQLFFTGSDDYTDQMALLIDNNETTCFTLTVADPGFSKWGGAVLSQMGGAHPVFR